MKVARLDSRKMMICRRLRRRHRRIDYIAARLNCSCEAVERALYNESPGPLAPPQPQPQPQPAEPPAAMPPIAVMESGDADQPAVLPASDAADRGNADQPVRDVWEQDDDFCAAMRKAIALGRENIIEGICRQHGTRHPRAVSAQQAVSIFGSAAAQCMEIA